jgi:F-type H+-transporting ATPase subunit a
MLKIVDYKKLALSFALIFASAIGFAQDHHGEEHEAEGTHVEEHHVDDHEAAHGEEEKFDPTTVVMHHIGDAHDFHIMDWDGHAVSVPLPVILWTDNGLVTFMSSAFHHDDHGSVVVEKKGMRFVKSHEKIYYASAEADAHGAYIEMDEEGHAINAKPLDLSITKNVFTLIFSSIIIFLIFASVGRSYSDSPRAPKGLAGFMEPLVLFVRDDIAIPNIGEKDYARFMPYLLTVFFFIWFNNLLGLVPFFPGSANLTGNIAVTLTLAVMTLIITNWNGRKTYWGHIFAPPVPKAIWPIMIPVEIIGIFTKPFALMIRLFANITAGHIVVLSLISLIFIFENVAMAGISVPFALFISVLELLVAALQAYIFTILSALFIGLAVEEHH